MDSLLCELPKVVKRNGVWQQSEEAFSYSPVDVSTLLRSWELNGTSTTYIPVSYVTCDVYVHM